MIEPGGRRSVLSPSPLPAPLHNSLGFLKAHAFSLADKIAIARGLNSFITGIPEDTEENFAHWLARHKQTPGAIKRFWEPVLFAALNEELDKTSVHYAAKVCRELFLRSPEAGRMAIPSVPLSDLYGHALQALKARGAEINLRTSVTRVTHGRPDSTVGPSKPKQDRFLSDAVIFAVPFEAMAKLLPTLPEAPGKEALAAQVSQFSHAPIAAIHLWFDREITDLEHASMLDTTIQWLFNKSKLQPQRHAEQGHYIEVVISVLRSVIPMQRQELIDLALKELALFFPAVREAKLLKGAVTKEVRATFSIRPQLDKIRPTSQSPWPNIFLAGDWTASGWPATMEGAARSGYLAAEALTANLWRTRRTSSSPTCRPPGSCASSNDFASSHKPLAPRNI